MTKVLTLVAKSNHVESCEKPRMVFSMHVANLVSGVGGYQQETPKGKRMAGRDCDDNSATHVCLNIKPYRAT